MSRPIPTHFEIARAERALLLGTNGLHNHPLAAVLAKRDGLIGEMYTEEECEEQIEEIAAPLEQKIEQACTALRELQEELSDDLFKTLVERIETIITDLEDDA